MAYNNTPLVTQTKAQSQPLIRENFQILQDYLQHNHEGINLSGKHTSVILPDQAVEPAYEPGKVKLFSMQNPNPPNTSRLYYKNGVDKVDFMDADNAPNGWTTLFSGLLMQWGQSPAVTGNGQVVYPHDIFTHVYYVGVTLFFDRAHLAQQDVNCAIRVVNYSDPQRFSVYGSFRDHLGANATTFTWIAIGD